MFSKLYPIESGGGALLRFIGVYDKVVLAFLRGGFGGEKSWSERRNVYSS